MQANATKRSIAVLGMGRSGTSMITAGLEPFGVHLGDSLLAPDTHENARGFYEDSLVVDINFRLGEVLRLSEAGTSTLNPDYLSLPEIVRFKGEAIEMAQRRFANVACWGFKDPRTAAVIGFWQAVFEAIGRQDSYIIAIRNPLSVVASLGRLGEVTPTIAMLAWLQRYVYCVSHIWNRPCVVVNYDHVMAEPAAQFERIAKAIDLPWSTSTVEALQSYANEFISGELRHSKHTSADLLAGSDAPRLVKQGWELLEKLGNDDVQITDPDFRKSWRAIEDEVYGLYPLFEVVREQSQELMSMTPAKLLAKTWRRRMGVLKRALIDRDGNATYRLKRMVKLRLGIKKIKPESREPTRP
ncbi:MAG: hypothetical protein HKL96_10195 [Phycisphaerales bacterium]|nr:hypothetical protein [Phycisphaerales bacterium]